MTTWNELDGMPYAGNPHVAPSQCHGVASRFDEEEVASCTAEASLRRVHCRRQPEGRASVCVATPRHGSLLCKWLQVRIIATALAAGTVSAASADHGLRHPSLAAAIEDAHTNLVARFVGPEGLLRDYEGEIPTPADCRGWRPSAMGRWSVTCSPTAGRCGWRGWTARVA